MGDSKRKSKSSSKILPYENLKSKKKETKKKNNKKIILSCCILLVVFIVLGVSSVKVADAIRRASEGKVFSASYSTTAMQGYETEVLKKYKRTNLPAVADEGLAQGYPKYGSTKGYSTTEQKNEVISEASYLAARPTKNATGTYDKMDRDGKLYNTDGSAVLDKNGIQRKLYKHSASVGIYLGDVSDDELAVEKQLVIAPRKNGNSYGVTGLYAPAGEVIKVEVSREDLSKCGGTITFHIGQALYNGQANNIWAAKNINRMPIVLNTMQLSAQNCFEYDEASGVYTGYIGSYLGGPIYVRSTSATVNLKISGAVEYRHFILGKTTEEEYNALSKSTAPYFDLEVWDYGVLHSGPVYYVKNYTYEDIYNAAILWEKISMVSTQYSKQGIVFLYDPFVAAGAAVAFPGRSSVNCPASWIVNALNYRSFIKSGAWGVIHEYNHNFQGWGLAGGGEVTNNALNLVSYAAFTEISSARVLTANGDGGLSGWNAYTNASKTLNQVLAKNYGGTNQLSIYATLLHNIGGENFMKTARRSGADNYFEDLSNTTGYDFRNFFELIGQTLSDSRKEAISAKNFKEFIPVASIYQTGRSLISLDGKKYYIKTMRPYEIQYGKDFVLNFDRYTISDGVFNGGTIVLPENYTYKIKGITKPANGSISKIDDKIYKFTPNKNLDSGEIYLMLTITNKATNISQDVDLVIELRQSHEMNKNLIERTIYTYESNNVYATSKEAYENNYVGYIDKKVEDNKNPTQNSSSDMWVPNPNTNAIFELSGKLYIAESGDYRIAIRGRHNIALYISKDGTNYDFAAELNHTTNYNGFWTEAGSSNYDENSFVDLKNLNAGSFVYFKEVLLVKSNASFTGLGIGKIEKPSGTMIERYNEATGKTEQVFVDENGQIIDETKTTCKVNYATAYRDSYEIVYHEFNPDYLFKRESTKTYDNSRAYDEKGTLVEVKGFTPWSDAEKIDNLFDDNDNNFIHSKKDLANGAYDITEENPFDLTVDLGTKHYVNTITIYGHSNYRSYVPKDYVLYGGVSLDDMRELKTVEGATYSNDQHSAIFDARYIRYYRFVCTKTYLSEAVKGCKYIAYRFIKFSYQERYSNGTQLAPDTLTYRGNWDIKYTSSSYGRVYVGQKKSVAEFEFTGKMFAIYSGVDTSNFDVYIDGKKIETATSSEKYAKGFSYLSKTLEEKTHKVKLIANEGIQIDSIVIW